MPLELPEPIQAYFEADNRDGAAVARCFTPTATVTDKGHDYSSAAAIAKWRDDAAAKYTYTVEPFAIERRDGVTIVSCHLEGTFPGGKADLRYFFRLADGRISSLEVKP